MSERTPRAALEAAAMSLIRDPDPALRGHGIVLCARRYLDALVTLIEQSFDDAATFREHDVEVSLQNLARAAVLELHAGRPARHFPDWASVAVGAPPPTSPDADDDAGRLSFEYLARRQAVLGIAPESIGLSRPDIEERAFGVLMETGYPEGTHTLACLADGTVHNDFSNGVISERLCDDDAVRSAALAFLACARLHYDAAAVTKRFPRPAEGKVCFYFLGPYEIRSYCAMEDALTNDGDPLSSLYHAGHEALSEIYAFERSLETSQERDEETL